MSNTSLFMVAGERSGDVYGAELVTALRARLPGVEIFGCGGEAMRRAGVDTTVDAHAVSVAGIVEIVSALPRIYRAYQQLLKEIDRRRPRLAILIDFPDFNLRLARQLKRRSVPVVYFVSPQIWAWRKGRLKQLKESITKMLCIFDFEEAIYRHAGIPVEYVGHPLVDLLHPSVTRTEFFSKTGLDPATPTVGLLPGSRASEVSYNLSPMLDAASRLSLTRAIQFVVAIAPTLDPLWLEAKVAESYVGRARVSTVEHSTFDVLKYSDVAIVASGTATLEAALAERPMVVVYRVSPLTWMIGKLMVDVPYYSMVNLLAQRAVVPELMQSDLNAQKLATEVEYLLEHPGARAEMAEELRALRLRLGPGGAIERAAEAVSGIWRGFPGSRQTI
jgi:lipid-A-disaccharide synthase